MLLFGWQEGSPACDNLMQQFPESLIYRPSLTWINCRKVDWLGNKDPLWTWERAFHFYLPGVATCR